MKKNVITNGWMAVALMMGIGSATLCRAQNSAVPKLAVLQNYVGEWDTTFTGDEKGMTAVVSAEWILDGRFVQQTGTVKDASGKVVLVLTTLMTYDANARQYRSWSFTSEGTTSEGVATWDAEEKTMTTKGKDEEGGATTTITATFARDGEEHWSIATEDASGNATSVIAGVNVRRAKK